MTLEGIVENGKIVLTNGVTLPEGTPVKVTVGANRRLRGTGKVASKNDPDAGSFFRSATIDELAAAQGKALACSFDDLLGGWSEEEKGDGFEETVGYEARGVPIMENLSGNLSASLRPAA